MKKTGIVLGVLITVTAIIYYAFTETIDTTPYFRSGYFSKSCAQADSLEKQTFPTNDSLYAGFAKSEHNTIFEQ